MKSRTIVIGLWGVLLLLLSGCEFFDLNNGGTVEPAVEPAVESINVVEPTLAAEATPSPLPKLDEAVIGEIEVIEVDEGVCLLLSNPAIPCGAEIDMANLPGIMVTVEVEVEVIPTPEGR